MHSFLDDTIKKVECQEILSKIGSLEDHYKNREKITDKLIEAGKEAGYKENWANRINECGSYIEADKNGNILASNFCRERFCPVCAWKRSLRLYGETFSMMSVIKNSYDYVFLTLTQKNIKYAELADEIEHINYAWKKFRQSKAMRNCKGFIRNIEVTINKSREEYHPHQHIIIAFEKGYFHDETYIKHAAYLEAWKKAYRGEVKNVYVTAVKDDNMEKAVAEIVKYSVKVNEASTYQNKETLKELLTTLKGKRLLTFSGIFKEIRKVIDMGDERGEKEHRYFRDYTGKYHEFEIERS